MVPCPQRGVAELLSAFAVLNEVLEVGAFSAEVKFSIASPNLTDMMCSLVLGWS